MITQVTYRWDDKKYAGWHVELWDGDTYSGSSRREEFPIRLSDYTKEQADELGEALKEAFPGAIIDYRPWHRSVFWED